MAPTTPRRAQTKWSAATSAPRTTAQTVKSIVVASSGNLVEWFDYFIYAFFSVYLAEQFFVGTGQTGAWMQAAAVFFVGFLMRPVGGYIFGRLADRWGRKNSMLTAIILMCAGSLAMAVLPTAHQVGALAPVLLLVVRCAQGISVGGEYGATATYMSEVARSGRRGFFSSFQYVTVIGGQLLASLLAVIMTHTLGEEQIVAGWWRLPFVIGALAAVVSMWLRTGLHETASSSDLSHAGSGTFREVLRHRRSFFVVLGITAFGSLIFYVFTTYMQKYLINTTGFDKGTAADTMTVCIFVYMCMQPVAGALSDRIGRKANMLIFTIAMIGLTVILMSVIGKASSPFVAGAAVLVGMAFISLYTSISGIVKAEMFPTHIRAMGVGFTYAIANSVFGGSAEYLALSMKNAGVGELFPWYASAIGIVGLIAVLFMHDNRKHSTIENPESSAYASSPVVAAASDVPAPSQRAQGTVDVVNDR